MVKIPYAAGTCVCGCGKRTRKTNAGGNWDHREHKRKAEPKAAPQARSAGAPGVTPPRAPRAPATLAALTPQACTPLLRVVPHWPPVVTRVCNEIPVMNTGETNAEFKAKLLTWVEQFRDQVVKGHVGSVLSYIWAAQLASLVDSFDWESKCVMSHGWLSRVDGWRAVVIAVCVHAMKMEFVDDDEAHRGLISALAGAVAAKDIYKTHALELVTFARTCEAESAVPAGSKSLLVARAHA